MSSDKRASQTTDPYTELSLKFAEQSALIEESASADEVSLNQILVMQQDMIHDYEEKMTLIEAQNDKMSRERDQV